MSKTRGPLDPPSSDISGRSTASSKWVKVKKKRGWQFSIRKICHDIVQVWSKSKLYIPCTTYVYKNLNKYFCCFGADWDMRVVLQFAFECFLLENKSKFIHFLYIFNSQDLSRYCASMKLYIPSVIKTMLMIWHIKLVSCAIKMALS